MLNRITTWLNRLSDWLFPLHTHCRACGRELKPSSGRPGVIGHWTNNIVYKRLAPRVLDELRRLTPRDESGRLKNKLFQRLTENVGHPKLREHLIAVVMLMKYAPNWEIFMTRLDKEFPQWGDSYMLPFPDDYEPPKPDPQSAYVEPAPLS